jgi:elongation factor G
VEKGVRETLARGVLAGYPVEDVRVILHFGKYHDVDSSEAAFKLAASMCFQDGFVKAKPVLLEPIVNLEITVPSQYMGDITGDLNSRRGRIVGMDSEGDLQIVRASAPMSEVMNYATELRSMTGGTGSFAMEFSHYDVVPARAAEQVIALAKKTKEEAGGR